MATLFVLRNEVGVARLGLTASRKLGKAVVRNRLRRRCREIYRRWPYRSQLPPVDIVVNLRHPAVHADFNTMKTGLERQLQSLLPRPS
jgi:ribonuclease P protein component